MNNKIKKLNEEKAIKQNQIVNAEERIKRCKLRIKEIDKEIESISCSDIITTFKKSGISIDELKDLIESHKSSKKSGNLSQSDNIDVAEVFENGTELL